MSVGVLGSSLCPDEVLRTRPNSRQACTSSVKPVHRATLTHLVRSAVESAPGAASLKTNMPQLPVIATDPEVSRALTPRQHEVLALLVQGKSNSEIAQALDMAENTVKVHLSAIFRVLGVHSRTGALLAGMKRLSARDSVSTLLLSVGQGPPTCPVPASSRTTPRARQRRRRLCGRHAHGPPVPHGCGGRLRYWMRPSACTWITCRTWG
jgi:DNA-binding CsgD family transcriptional regulator